MALRKGVLGVRHPDYAHSLNNLASLLHAKGDHKAALPLFKEALALRKGVLGLRHPDYAQSLNNLALLLKDMGDHKEALPLFKEAVALFKEVLGVRHPGYATSLNNLAGLYHAMGDPTAALSLYKEALSLTKEALGIRHPSYAMSLDNLAGSYQSIGDYKAALPLYKEALALRKEALGVRHPAYAQSLNNLALLLKALGDHKAALPLAREALALRKEVLGVRHPDYATSLSDLAALYHAMRDHKGALPLAREALALRKEVLGVRHPDYALSLNNLALLLKALGDHKAALPLAREALALRKEVLGVRHPDYATSLSDLAALYHAMRDHKGALPLAREALALRKEVLGVRHPDYALSLNNLALLLKALGDHKAALPLAREALALRKEVLGVRHPDYATSLSDLASLLGAMGDYKAAISLYKEASELTKEVLGVRHPNYSTSLNNLALYLNAMGDHKAALPLIEESILIVSSTLRDNASVLSDRQQLANLALLRHRLDNRLHIGDDGPPSVAAHVLAWKGTLFQRQTQRRLFLRLSADPETKAAAERLQDVTRRLVTLRSWPAATREKLDALQAEQDESQAKLSELSAAFREERARGAVSPEALAKSLPEDAVLVDYIFYHDRLAAFVHRRGRKAVRVDLGKAAPVLSAVHEWRPLLTRGKTGLAQGAVLKRLVWLPLERHLEGAKVVLVSPDGPLGTVPFAALPGRRSGSYLIEDVAVAVVPVPSALPELMRKPDPKERLKPTLLVAGDLRYDPAEKADAPAAGADDRSAPRTGRERFGRLAATAAEALAVRAAFEKLFKGGVSTHLTEGDATKAAIREALAKVRYAHLATHGYFAPEEVKPALAHDAKARPGGEAREVTGWHPLLLSGLALSDANREPKPGEEDGILTALEVSEMDLTRLELAVLSACETGLGQVAGGEGILGMQRAFQVAGARSVIASMWKVDDRATQVLMGDFYKAAWDTKKVISRAEALRQAQLALLKEGRKRGLGEAEEVGSGEEPSSRLPPFYWAAFVLSGDWR